MTCYGSVCNHAHSGGMEIVRVAPPPTFYVGVLLVILIVAVWGFYIEGRLRDCTCKRGTHLKPKWKKYDKEDL